MENKKENTLKELKEKIEKVYEDFTSTNELKLKNKSFTLYSKYIDKLVDIKNPSQEVDDYIFECIGRAKDMRKAITVNPKTEGVVDKLIRTFLLEQEPEMKWGDIIGLKPHRELFLTKVILPAKKKKFAENGVKKVMLFGGPGNGKTMLAKAMAFETEYNFFNSHCSYLIQKNTIKEAFSVVKELFSNAEKYKPSIIFFDEFDLLYPENEEERTEEFDMMTELIWEKIENLDLNGEIGIFAATNKPWKIPLARFKNFDLRLILDVPDQDTRVNFLNAKLKSFEVKLSEELIQEIALKAKG